MNAFLKINISEATRLAREGRLQEAMALLQGKQPTGQPSAAPAFTETSMPVPADRTRPLAGLLPPPAGSAQSRTATGPTDFGWAAMPRARPQALPTSWPELASPASKLASRVWLDRLSGACRRRCLSERGSRTAILRTEKAAAATSFTFRAAMMARLCRSSSCCTAVPNRQTTLRPGRE